MSVSSGECPVYWRDLGPGSLHLLRSPYFSLPCVVVFRSFGMTSDSWSTGVAANVPRAQGDTKNDQSVCGFWGLQWCSIAKSIKTQLLRPGHHPDHSFRETLSMGGRLVDPAMLVDSGRYRNFQAFDSNMVLHCALDCLCPSSQLCS